MFQFRFSFSFSSEEGLTYNPKYRENLLKCIFCFTRELKQRRRRRRRKRHLKSEFALLQTLPRLFCLV